MSWDVGPGNDGSYLDFYRYMIDVASMDSARLRPPRRRALRVLVVAHPKVGRHVLPPPRFVPLYGYERSVMFPNGHRNVFHAARGVPIFPFQLKLDQTGVFPCRHGPGRHQRHQAVVRVSVADRRPGDFPYLGHELDGTIERDNDPASNGR